MTEEEVKTQESAEIAEKNEEKEEVTTYELEDEDFKLFEVGLNNNQMHFSIIIIYKKKLFEYYSNLCIHKLKIIQNI